MDESKKFGKYENYGEMILDHKRNVTHPWHFFPTVYGEFYKNFQPTEYRILLGTQYQKRTNKRLNQQKKLKCNN